MPTDPVNVPLINAKPVKLPGAKEALVSSATFGSPLATLIIWYLDTYVCPGMIPLAIATIAGGLISTAVGTLWHIFRQLLHRRGIEV